MKVQHLRWPFAGLLILFVIGGIVASNEAVTFGVSAVWSEGTYRFAGGSGLWALAFSGLDAFLYFLLMRAMPSVCDKPLQGLTRRFAGFWLDFGIAMGMFVPIAGLFPVIVEWRRTHVFAWTFERETQAASDLPVASLTTIAVFSGLLLYHAIPMARRRPSPGTCIVGYQVVAESGGSLNLRQALVRTFLGSISLWATPFVGRSRKRGKIWPDKAAGTVATLLD